MYEKPKRKKPIATMERPECKEDFSNYTLAQLEIMYAAEYEGWLDGDKPYSFGRMLKLREVIVKRKNQAYLKKLFDEVI